MSNDLIFALYAEWLMAQPEARVCNGFALIERMEESWGWQEFVGQLPAQLEPQVRAYLGAE